MRTMASVCFFVIVLVSVQNVFGNVCLKEEKEFTCDECLRCGGDWCKDPGLTHCSLSPGDQFCPNNQEYTIPVHEQPDKKGVEIYPVYAERNLVLKNTGPDKLDIHYSANSKQMPNLTIVHTTQTFNIEVRRTEPQCSGSTCVFTVETTAAQDFCYATGGLIESVEVKVNVGLKEEAHIKYFVPCACACSQQVERNLPHCKNGNFSCGFCACDPGWKGIYCDQVECDQKRGDDVYQCSQNSKSDEDCSGNGYCGPCDTCVCYTDREGSQYFVQENNCAGLCEVVSECEDCLQNNTIGDCNTCTHTMTIERYNETLTHERDEQKRKIWVKCTENIDDCGQYFAKRDGTGIHVMIVNQCNEVAGAIVADTKVPIILGVLAVLAVVAAVGGVMLWKHMNTVPPVPLNDPQYQNIDAEDCRGENPLYRPPTSSFKNPTYGKW